MALDCQRFRIPTQRRHLHVLSANFDIFICVKIGNNISNDHRCIGITKSSIKGRGLACHVLECNRSRLSCDIEEGNFCVLGCHVEEGNRSRLSCDIEKGNFCVLGCRVEEGNRSRLSCDIEECDFRGLGRQLESNRPRCCDVEEGNRRTLTSYVLVVVRVPCYHDYCPICSLCGTCTSSVACVKVRGLLTSRYSHGQAIATHTRHLEVFGSNFEVFLCCQIRNSRFEDNCRSVGCNLPI